jgi:putative MFS transporter
MFFNARSTHYRLAGMPLSGAMLSEMAMTVAGIAVTAWGLYPRRPPDRELSRISIAPLDDARLRPGHVMLVLVLAIAITIDGMKPVAFAFLAPGAAAEYGLRSPLHPAVQALSIGLYPLAGITGTTIGSLVWGSLGDRIGRRASILLAAIIFIATSACGVMPAYWLNLVTCLIMGLGVGGMLPIAFALLCETIPARHRGWMMVLVGGNLASAYIIVSWLASTWASPAHFGWRLLWLVGLPTGLLLLLLNRWIPESPRFLLQQGRDAEAAAVLRRYGAVVTHRDPDPVERLEPRAGAAQLFRGSFAGLSAAILMLAVSVGVAQYGFQQWLPSNLQRLGMSPAAASGMLRDAALFGFPFCVPVALLYARWSSKRTVIAAAGLLACALALFTILGNRVSANHTAFLVLLAVPIWGLSILAAVLMAYAAEVYPTGVRARGTGLSAMATKAGGVAILAIAVLTALTPSIRLTAAAGLIPMVVALVALAVYGPETRRKSLEQITAEELRLAEPVVTGTERLL